MSKPIKKSKTKQSKRKLIARNQRAMVSECPCPNGCGGHLTLDKHNEAFCDNCGVHVSPVIFRRLVEAG